MRFKAAGKAFCDLEWSELVVAAMVSILKETPPPSPSQKVAALENAVNLLQQLGAPEAFTEQVVDVAISASIAFPCEVVVPAVVALLKSLPAKHCRNLVFMKLLGHCIGKNEKAPPKI